MVQQRLKASCSIYVMVALMVMVNVLMILW